MVLVSVEFYVYVFVSFPIHSSLSLCVVYILSVSCWQCLYSCPVFIAFVVKFDLYILGLVFCMGLGVKNHVFSNVFCLAYVTPVTVFALYFGYAIVYCIIFDTIYVCMPYYLRIITE